jgi:hypothetical protein
MTEEELEKIIRDLVRRKNALPLDSPERAFYERQLRAIRYGPGDEAGGIIEEADPDHWGCYCRPLPPAASAERKVLQLRRSRRRPPRKPRTD